MNSFNLHLPRRRFLQSLAAAAGVPLWYLEEQKSHAATTRPLSPNDRPGIALIGCGGQGTGDTNWARSFGNVVAVADVDEQHAANAKQHFKAEAAYRDFRKLLERDDVHVIINGTPDHWHSLINVAAARAGKDIYTEKPMTLTIAEGQRLVQEVRKHQRILQVGSQQRSDGKFRLACELVRNGRIGTLKHMIVGLPTGPRQGPFPKQPIPTHIDWDFYLGQAPVMDYHPNKAHGNFRWWYAFSGGQMTDWGAHHNDIAQWGNGSETSGPTEIDGKSLLDMVPDGYDAASKYRIEMRYANGVTMSILDESTPHEAAVVGGGKSTPNGVQFLGSQGWIYVSRGEIRAHNPEIIESPLPTDATRLYKSDNHMGNFFDCVRSRKDPICTVEIGHRSISVAHLGVISVRLGRKLKWDPEREEFPGDTEANAWTSRPMRKPYDWSFVA